MGCEVRRPGRRLGLDKFPLAIIDAQRRDLLRRLREVGRAVMEEEKDSDAALLLEGIVLRLQADLRWLQACEMTWTKRSTPK